MDDITDHYNAGWDIEASRLERHQLERDITWRYLDAYLPPGGRILEVGIGAGHYTFELARRGYRVTAVDLAEEYVCRCETRAREIGLDSLIEFRTGDARDLEGLPECEFEAVLLMGPLYHLVFPEDRLLALRRAHACLKPGGVLFLALISRFGILGDRLKNAPEWIEKGEEIQSILRQGHRPAHAPRGGFRGYYVTRDEVLVMQEASGFQTAVVAGVEPAISADDASYT